MSPDDRKPPLIVLLGPTAVGKTTLSLQLAKRFNGEIISADSRLFYRGMDIGTAKPGADVQNSVPHHLIDVAEINETWSLGRFIRRTLAAIQDIHHQGKVPFLVGGTGQFIKAITEGWVVPEQKADEKMRIALHNWAEEIDPEGLYQRLRVIDPVAAGKIQPGNLRRTVRALEVIFNSGQKFSEVRRKEPVPFDILQIGLIRPRPEIDARINARVDAMMAAGFLDEVREILAQGYSADLPSMSAFGYRQLADYLTGQGSLEEAVEEIKQVTRKFYRRQMTWFKRKDERIHWIEMSEDPLRLAEEVITAFLQPEN